MSKNSKTARIELFKQIALIQLQTRRISVFRAHSDKIAVSQDFLDEVALLTETLLSASEAFGEQIPQMKQNPVLGPPSPNTITAQINEHRADIANLVYQGNKSTKV